MPCCERCSLPVLFTLGWSNCNVEFAGLPACDIRRLQSVLNSSDRLVTAWSSEIWSRGVFAIRDHHWLPIAELIEYKLCTLVYRCSQGNAPQYLADHVALTSSVGRRRRLRSEDTLILEVHRTRLSFGDSAFSFAGPRTWNKLPINVRSAQSVHSFRKLFKTFIFQHAYSSYLNVLLLVRPLPIYDTTIYLVTFS